MATANHKIIAVVGRERTRAGVAGPLDTPIHIAISLVCGFVDFFYCGFNSTPENKFEDSFFHNGRSSDETTNRHQPGRKQAIWFV